MANTNASQGVVAPTTSAPVQNTVVAPVEPVQQVVQQPVQQPAVDNAASQRTQDEFGKLLDSNRKLHQANSLLQEEIARRTQVQQQFAPVQQPSAPQQPNIQDFVEIDPETGTKYINEQKLQSAIQTANSRAAQAVQQMDNYIRANEQRELDRQNKEAFIAYPELNPSNKDFNAGLSNTVSAVILHSYMNPRNYTEGRPLTFKEAAELVKKGYNVDQPTPIVTVPVQQQVTTPAQDAKVDASLNLGSVPQQVMQSPQVAQEIASLRERTRLGDEYALAERLKYTEHLIPKEGTS